MTIFYALVSRKKTVLAEYTSSTGNFTTVTRVLLAKIDSDHDTKMSYVYDKHVFHYIIDQGITFLCMSDESMKRRVVFSFLQDIIATWRSTYTAAVEQSALAFTLNQAFGPVLQKKIDAYNSNITTVDNISNVQAQLDEVKDVMIENIDRVLERGEKIELLVERTDQLNQQSFRFEKSSRMLKRTMYMRKLKNYAIAAVMIIVLVLIITMMACGITFSQCRSK